jgi:enoyl-CoA hydratase
MSELVTYALKESIATITMDDGKVNVLSLDMIAALNRALDRAAADKAVVVLTGREGRFSAGFDLGALGSGGNSAVDMLREGFLLSARLLSFERPVVIVCTGHAIAMGVFLLLSGDYRLGAAGPYRINANEVAIGLTMPRAAVEVCRQRLAPAHFNRAVILAEPYAPDDTAVAAGFFDRVVQPGELQDAARGVAERLANLNMDAHAASKVRAREQALRAIRAAIEADDADFRALTAAAQQA